MDERREHPRLKKPLDASWRGHSGASPCRIADISWGGCFVETLALPSVGEETTVIVPVRGATIEIRGRVGYIERTMGFSVTFDRLAPGQIDVLTDLLGEPPASVLT